METALEKLNFLATVIPLSLFYSISIDGYEHGNVRLQGHVKEETIDLLESLDFHQVESDSYMTYVKENATVILT